MKRTIVILDITYDEHSFDHPTAWNWNTIADVGVDENIMCVGFTDIE